MTVAFNRLTADRRQSLLFAVDMVMIGLLVANLTLIVFDSMFASAWIQQALRDLSPAFYRFYNDRIHQHFFFYDLCFVAVFVTELLIRWGISIRQHRHQHWYHYPFVHWYDVLGCIPVSSLRILRFLRVFAILVRLHKLGVIDLTETGLYRFCRHYLNALIEEITDRVTVRMLTEIKLEIRRDNPLAEQIVEQVLQPNREVLVEALSHRVQQLTARAHRVYRNDIERYLRQLVGEAMDNNRHLANLEKLPGIGTLLTAAMEQAISDAVTTAIDQAVDDLASPRNKRVVDNLTNLAFDALLFREPDPKLRDTTKDILCRSIDLIIDQIRVQQWRLRDRTLTDLDLQPDSRRS